MADLPKEFVQKLIGYLFTNVVELTSATNVEDYEEQIDFFIEFMKDGLRR